MLFPMLLLHSDYCVSSIIFDIAKMRVRNW